MKKVLSLLTAATLLVTPLSLAAAAPDVNMETFTVESSEVGDFSNGYAAYYINGLYGFIRYDGRIMSDAIYQDVKAYSDGLWPVQTEHGWQFVNMDGTLAIAGPFDTAEAFNFGISVVSANGKYGAISSSGEYVIEPAWDYISAFNASGLASAMLNDKWSIINASGNVITTKFYDEIVCTDPKASLARTGDDTYDVILNDGTIANTLTVSNNACLIIDSYLTYKVGDTCMLAALDGTVVFSYTPEIADDNGTLLPAGDNMVMYAGNSGSRLYNIETGMWLGSEEWARVSYSANDIAIVQMTDDTYMYADMNGNLLGETRWTDATNFHYGVACVCDGTNWLIIDSEQNVIGTIDGTLNTAYTFKGFEDGYVVSTTAVGDEIVTRIPGSAIEGGDFAIDNGTVTGYRGEGGDVRIPDGVTAIADGAFQGNEDIKSLSLPDSLVSIGAHAFDSCVNLSGKVYIPAGVTEIGEGAFYNAAGITAFDVALENTVYLSWDGGLATLDGTFVQYPCGSIAQYYSLPYNTVKIADRAFNGATGLKYVNVPYDAADKLDISDTAFTDDDSIYIICNKDTQAAAQALERDIPLLTVYTTPEPTVEPTAEPTVIPTEEPTIAPTAEPTGIPGKTMVYFNPRGKYYHSVSDCSGMKNAGYFTLDDAIAGGKQACPVCNPPIVTDSPSLATAEPTVIPTEEPTAEPTVEPTTAPTAEPTGIPGEIMVYYTPNGTYYHSVSDCSGMKNAGYFTLTEAIADGKQPCKACNPPLPTEAPTEIPTEEPAAEPTVIPTEEPAAEPTPEITAEPTAEPEVTDEPEHISTMFGADDLFAGTFTLGVTTHAEVDAFTGETMTDEYTDEAGLVNGTYSFGYARYNADDVLVYIEVNATEEMMTVRELTVGNSIMDVLMRFENPEVLDGSESATIYEDELGSKGTVTVQSGKPTAVTYQYMLDDENVMVLTFSCMKGRVICVTQYMTTLEALNAAPEEIPATEGEVG